MSTTLTAARKALLALVNTLPSPSTYADHAAVVADYLDNQVPLNIENKALREQLAARGYTEGFGRIKPKLNFEFCSGDKHALSPDLGNRRFMAVKDD